MAVEFASHHARSAIEMLLHVHALTNMHRGSGNFEHAKTALGWFDKIESSIKCAREEIEQGEGD